MKRVIYNQKGGVGKTSITCNLAAACAKRGKKVLVIDLDPQANSTHYLLGPHADSVTLTIADYFQSTIGINLFKSRLSEIVLKTPYKNLYLIPSHPELSEIQTKLESKHKILKLKQAVSTLLEEKQFDEVFFDTPPAMNFYSLSALLAADSILIPFDCDAFSANAVHQVINTVEEIVEDHEIDLKVEGVVINQFQRNAKIPQQAVTELIDSGLNVIEPYISSSVVMRESHATSTPLIWLKENHKLSKEYIELSKNI